MIEMKKPLIPDVRKLADSLAESWGGKVSDKKDALDGEDACRIVAVPKTDLQPVEALACIHEGRLYLIEGGVTIGHTCHAEIESIRKGWKWIPLEPPIRHLEFRDQPAVFFNGQVSMNFPAGMSLSDDGHPEKSIGIGLHNFQLDRSEFTAIIQFTTLADGDTLAKAEDRLAKGLQAQLKLPEPFTWHALKSGSRGGMTNALPGPASDGKNWIMWGIVELPGHQIVLANFTLYAEDPSDRALYAATARKIMETVAPAK